MWTWIKTHLAGPQLVVEVLSIVLAVTLALGVNEWRENRANAKLAAEAFDSIKQEIKRNQGIFAAIYPHHKTLLDSLVVLQERASAGGRVTFEDLTTLNFVPAYARETAWNTSQATRAIAHMDFQTVSQISDVYTIQQAYRELNSNFILATIMPDSQDRERVDAQLNAAVVSLQAFVAFEGALLSAYADVLKSFESEPDAP